MAARTKTRRRRPVRYVSAEKALSSTYNAQQLKELRILRFPSPTGKAGRPPKQRDLFSF